MLLLRNAPAFQVLRPSHRICTTQQSSDATHVEWNDSCAWFSFYQRRSEFRDEDGRMMHARMHSQEAGQVSHDLHISSLAAYRMKLHDAHYLVHDAAIHALAYLSLTLCLSGWVATSLALNKPSCIAPLWD